METGDMNGVQIDTAAHVLIFPFPAQGHVTSMLKLGELLSLSGLHVTFVNSDYNHRRLTRFSAAFARLARRPGFFFRSIPDGLDDDRPRTGSRFLELEEALRTRSVGLFLDQLVTRAEPRVTCAIVDGLMPFAIEAAEGVGVPAIAFRTSSSASYWAYFCIPRLVQSGELPFPGEQFSLSAHV